MQILHNVSDVPITETIYTKWTSKKKRSSTEILDMDCKRQSYGPQMGNVVMENISLQFWTWPSIESHTNNPTAGGAIAAVAFSENCH